MTTRKKAPKAAKANGKADGMSGEQLDKAITKLGFSQSSFSRTIQVNDRTVRSWISGQYPVPTVVAMLVNLMIETEATVENLQP
jgi:DNA-binding transcriptional regulator YiaG